MQDVKKSPGPVSDGVAVETTMEVMKMVRGTINELSRKIFVSIARMI